MPGPQVQVEMSVDAARAWAGLMKVSQGAEGLERGLSKSAKAAREAEREQQKMGREGKRLFEQMRTPLEAHNARLKRYDELLKHGSISQQTHRRAVKASERSLREAGDAGMKAFGPGARQALAAFTGAFLGGGGLQGAIQTVTKEYQNMQEAQERAAETSLTEADAQIKALRNLGADTPKQREAYLAQVERIAKDTDVSERDIHLRASAALSRKGDLPVSAAMAAVKESARIVPESAAEGTAVAGAALDIAKITGSQDARANIGLLMGIGQTAEVSDIGLLAQNLAPAMVGVAARGDTGRQAGALWAAFTQGMGDETGRRSGTAAVQLAEQLAKFLPTEATYERMEVRTEAKLDELKQAGKIDKAAYTQALGEIEAKHVATLRVVDRQATGMTSTEQRIRAMQGDAMLREQFLGEASFEVKARAPVEQLLSGKGTTARSYEQFLQRIPTAAESVPIYEQRLGVIRGGELQQTARFDRAMQGLGERLETLDQEKARVGIARRHLKKILQDTGQTALAQQFDTMEFEVSSRQAYDRMIGTLAFRRDELLRGPQRRAMAQMIGHEPSQAELMQARQFGMRGIPELGIGGFAEMMAPPTDVERSQARELTEAIKTLVELRDAAQALKDVSARLDAVADKQNAQRPVLGHPNVDR